jgi:hypothetical protein
MSVVEGRDLLLQNASFLVILIGSTVAGLFLDEARHTWLEPKFEEKWATEKGFDLSKLDDFVAYVPKMGIDLYKLIRDEYYYYYEFDINMTMALVPAIFVAPMYLQRFSILTGFAEIIVEAMLLGMALCFFVFGRGGYEYFLDTFASTMEKKEPGFKKDLLPKGGTRD